MSLPSNKNIITASQTISILQIRSNYNWKRLLPTQPLGKKGGGEAGRLEPIKRKCLCWYIFMKRNFETK